VISAPVTLGLRMDKITLSVPVGPPFHGTVRLVVGGIGMRSELTYDEISELQLAVENLIAHRPVDGDTVTLEAEVDGNRLSLLVGPFAPDQDEGRLRVLRQLVAGVEVLRRDGSEWLELSAGRQRG
jgi:hypothetical protein